MHWLLALVLVSQDGDKLEVRPAPGDKSSVTVESHLDLDIEVQDGNGKVTRVLGVTRKEKFEQEITAVADGRASGLRIRCAFSTVQKSGSGIPLADPVATPVQGRSFLATRAGAGWSVKDPDGGTPPAEAQAVGAWNDVTRLLPTGELRVDATWKVEAVDVSALLGGAMLADATGSLDCKCESISGNRAVILFTGQIEGKGVEGAATRITVAPGRLVFDVGAGKALSLSIAGALESRREVIELYQKPQSQEQVRRSVGSIITRSKKLEVNFTFE